MFTGLPLSPFDIVLYCFIVVQIENWCLERENVMGKVNVTLIFRKTGVKTFFPALK